MIKIKIFEVNGKRFTVESNGQDYLVRYKRLCRQYRSAPCAHREVLCSALDDWGKAKKLDLVTVNWPMADFQEIK